MKLPVELLDTISDNLTETADLRSLGLTCKYLAKSILREKLFYHTISGSLNQRDLWIHLIMNPEISRHIRRLQITKGTVPNPKMRLQVDLCKNHPYSRPENVEPLLWSYQLFARALCQMVNLKAFEWSFNKTPVFNANSDIGKDYPNLRVLKQVSNSSIPMHFLTGGSYISIFDIPTLHSISLISLTITVERDALDSGKSIIIFLTRSLGLKYLKLRIIHQAFLGDLFSLCRWPNLEVLSLSIGCDHSKAPNEESIIEFIGFHSNIISLEWHLDYLDEPWSYVAIPLLPSNFLPHLRAIDANTDTIQSVVLSPCVPPRPLEKITGFLTYIEAWDHLQSFKYICQSSLRIISIRVKSISQMAHFAALFPNVESIDIRGSDVLSNIDPTRDEMRLRVILGIRLWEYDKSGEIEVDDEFFQWIHIPFPHLEYCGAESWNDAIAFRRDGNSVDNWHRIRLPHWQASFRKFKFSGREQGFTIREECDRFAS
ncbi:hypothetical protein Clacol_004982 [Clathrus columnatus]|uniref:F-box domain-containing protein n=1 Tax=Clathrus columnatus TaxID=1419009 RepID=A0AAV5A807_9AGAM|nr:hypothetical protein Clacol_004982 [Clathrus columnatus]